VSGRIGHGPAVRRRRRRVPAAGRCPGARRVRWPRHVGQRRRRVTGSSGRGQHRVVGAGRPPSGRIVRGRDGLGAGFGRRFLAFFVPISKQTSFRRRLRRWANLYVVHRGCNVYVFRHRGLFLISSIHVPKYRMYFTANNVRAVYYNKRKFSTILKGDWYLKILLIAHIKVY